MTGSETKRTSGTQRWKIAVRVLQVMLGFAVAFAVWSIGFASDHGPLPVLPDTDIQSAPDLDVVDTSDHSVVYVVEQRARPDYRIFAFDPTTGSDATIFTVPEDAVIFGIALSNDATTLAVSYSPDFRIDGSGLWTLDLTADRVGDDADAMTEIVGATEGVYLTEPAWSGDDRSVFNTHVDSTGDDEQLAVAETSIDSGISEIRAEGAISPVLVGDIVYFLDVDEDGARRSIGSVDTDGRRGSIAVADGAHDLDEFVARRDGNALLVSVIESDDDTSAITIGQTAEAHGDHDVPSTWWTVPLDGTAASPLGTDDEVMYDATVSGDSIVSATGEGLSVTSMSTIVTTLVIESRAMGFVAG